MAKVFISLVFFGIVIFWGSHVIGQEWTAEQKEIWKLIEADYELFKQGDLQGILASRHDDLVIWWYNRFFPMGKKALANSLKLWFASDKPVNWELKPLDIKVSGNVASVFYEFKYSGTIYSGHARSVLTLIRQDRRWLIINGLSCSCDKLPSCER
jgi:ketosteroid isomerase-like protein